MRSATTLMCALAFFASNARGDMNQFWLAAQHDWGGKRGFFLNLHSDFPAGSKATLDTLRITLGVGDGSEWHILAHQEKWQLDKPYKAKGVRHVGEKAASVLARHLRTMEAVLDAPVETLVLAAAPFVPTRLSR